MTVEFVFSEVKTMKTKRGDPDRRQRDESDPQRDQDRINSVEARGRNALANAVIAWPPGAFSTTAGRE